MRLGPCRPPLEAFIGPDTLKWHEKLDPASYPFRIQMEKELERLQKHDAQLLEAAVTKFETEMTQKK